VGWGGPKFGNFIAFSGSRSGHFLDTPEIATIHDIGNTGSLFDRMDWQPGGKDVFHLNLFAARNWFQIPNSFDQLSQDQRQRVLTWSIAPGYQHTFSGKTLLTVNPFVRRDQLNFYGSRDPFSDAPVFAAQKPLPHQLRREGRHRPRSGGATNSKSGTQIQQTRLLENFQFGVTDPNV